MALAAQHVERDAQDAVDAHELLEAHLAAGPPGTGRTGIALFKASERIARRLLEVGTVLAFGSDCPVEDLSPFLGIHAAVTRRRTDGSPGPEGWYPGQRLTVEEAVRAYTSDAAYAAGTEDRLGSLTPGKLADLVVLDRDIFSCDLLAIAETQVVATMIGGQFVHGEV